MEHVAETTPMDMSRMPSESDCFASAAVVIAWVLIWASDAMVARCALAWSTAAGATVRR